ncbi:helicase [Aureococcus anophagefferens]|nr:helicase [Aureococcus anophagefferens]
MLLMLLLALRSAASLVAPRPSSLLRAGAPRGELGDYFALPAEASAALAARGIEVAAPAQEAFWTAESLAMLLPAVYVLWGGAKGSVPLPAVARELVAQHADVLGALAGEGAVASVTTSGVGAPGGSPAAATLIVGSASGDPSELCAVLERADLYGALNVEALVLDELDLLMPARKFGGKRERSGLKVRAVADALGARAAGETVVLNDALFPSSQRNRAPGYAP